MRLINLEILGQPINTILVIMMIVLFWFAFYSVKSRASSGANSEA